VGVGSNKVLSLPPTRKTVGTETAAKAERKTVYVFIALIKKILKSLNSVRSPFLFLLPLFSHFITVFTINLRVSLEINAGNSVVYHAISRTAKC
jgi:hypothetical protein